jgi:hypothetical protein
MDTYNYKYLKYKKKYLNLSNQRDQQGGTTKYTINDLANLITTAQNNNEKYITIQSKRIHTDRAILINDTIYDSVLLLQDIIENPNEYVNSMYSKKFNELLDKTSDSHYYDIDDTRFLMKILHKNPKFDDIRDQFKKS